MSHTPLIGHLIESLRVLPGVGPKSAQRMAYHLLERDRPAAVVLANALLEAADKVGHCRDCRTLSECERCPICENGQRDRGQICVVETPTDVSAVEKTAAYRGVYFVLMGRLSPLDGIGPEDLGLKQLEDRLAGEGIREMIVATNPTVEGEATAFYLQRMAQKQGITVSRIAHGVPLGGELEFTDQSTIAHAFTSRQAVDT